MKKIMIWSCVVTILCLMFGVTAAISHDGSHHQEPGYGHGGSCYLGDNFHHYNSGNYGTGHNVWCNGTNPQLNQHHRGNPINAALPADSSFVGGFCLKSNIGSGENLKIEYKDLVPHDKVWLLSKEDGMYYPVDKQPSDNFILVAPNSWSDVSSTTGQVEADVLLSRSSTVGNDHGGGGGGCDTGAGALGALGLALACAVMKRKS